MNRTVKKAVFLGILLNLLPFSFYAQESKFSQLMTIDEMFSMAENNSQAIKLSDLTIAASQQEVKISKNAQLPSVDISLSAGYLGDLRVMERNFKNGQTIDLTNFGKSTNFNSSLAIEASQIIYAGGAIKNAIDNAELNTEISKLEKKLTIQNLRFMLISYYLEIYKRENEEEVILKNIEQTEKLITDIRNKEKEGMALKNDITRYELQLQSLNLGLTQSRNAKLIASNRLCTLLKLPIGSSIQVDKTIIEELPLSQSIEYWQNTATDSSLTLKKADLQLQQTEHSRKIVRSERIPQIALYASNHLDGPITIDIDMKNNNINVWTVGVGLKYNLASLYKTNRNLKRADIARLQASESLILIKENLETEVYSAHTLFVEMFSILETHKKSLELATLNYDVINRRYLNELATITDMLDATNSKLEAELNMANAKINLLLRYYNLKRVTGIL
mgnify:FL=1